MAGEGGRKNLAGNNREEDGKDRRENLSPLRKKKNRE